MSPHNVSIDISLLPTRGLCSKYEITDSDTGESFRGKLIFTVEGDAYRVTIYNHTCIPSQ